MSVTVRPRAVSHFPCYRDPSRVKVKTDSPAGTTNLLAYQAKTKSPVDTRWSLGRLNLQSNLDTGEKTSINNPFQLPIWSLFDLHIQMMINKKILRSLEFFWFKRSLLIGLYINNYYTKYFPLVLFLLGVLRSPPPFPNHRGPLAYRDVILHDTFRIDYLECSAV